MEYIKEYDTTSKVDDNDTVVYEYFVLWCSVQKVFTVEFSYGIGLNSGILIQEKLLNQHFP